MKIKSSLPKCLNKKRVVKKKPSQPLDIESICTYHLVQITLGRVEKLLKQLSSTSSRKEIQKVGVLDIERTSTKPGDRHSTDGHKVVSTSQLNSDVIPQHDLKEVTTPRTPVMKYRWIADVREGAPGFADDDRCTSEWFSSREAAEEDMNKNVEKKCSEHFPYLRWITNVYIEEKKF